MDGPDIDEMDVIDQTTLKAREVAPEALSYLITVMLDDSLLPADRLKAAQHSLEVAGCLSL